MTDALPLGKFAECDMNDDLPFPGWEPSPEQIAAWSAAIRSEWTAEQTQKRIRPDWRSDRVECTTAAVVTDQNPLIE